ncbi:YfhE family protein [Sporosarcina sp. GW1-11]|uniref:YfhE family protein n=1 Tax=Sporosarcina sp. GW1-11 TaxID=2899126 RepID=UPI00294BC073|nr:YfhE family protein [Sporosarcina sp. GW1-11]MDV6379362.1 YfhE family protein [Sporosarcina sp. GW1-11]
MFSIEQKKQPHKTLTDKNNGLSSAQEVLYAKDFKKADQATEKDNNKKSNN